MTARKIEYSIDENGCHICTSHKTDKCGYPIVRRNNKKYQMIRFLWEEKYGLIPKGMEICHKCNNPTCINLNHVELGTHKYNMEYMAKTGRAYIPKGEKNPNRKLTKEQVLQIRQEVGSCVEIAKRYGVGHSMINYIKNRKNWKSLGEDNA